MPAPSSNPLAQAALELLVGERTEPALILVTALIEHKSLDPHAEVSVPQRSGSEPPAVLPLLDGVRTQMRPGHYNPGLHTPAVAHGFLALDPDFFAPENNPDWFWNYLKDWANTDFQRLGFQRGVRAGDTQNADHWAAAVIARLPDSAFERDAAQTAWRSLVRLGFPHAMAEFGRRRPMQWQATETNGHLVIARAKEAWLLDVLLAGGVDLWAVLADGRPLWRHLAPKSPSVLPEKGSLIEAVERWAGTAAGETPQQRAALDGFLREALADRMGHGNWATQRPANRLAYLDGLPLSWVRDGWPDAKTPLPIWAQPFLTRRREQDKSGRGVFVSEAVTWARALQERPALREAIGPLADLAAWLIEHGRKRSGAQAPEAVIDAARHPQAAALLEELRQRLPAEYGSSAALATLTEAVLLQAQTPEGGVRRKLRL